MAVNDAVERFRQLAHQYDQEYGRGAALDVKDDLGLGSGLFNDKLSTSEVRLLNRELTSRLAPSSD